jgi:putative IMPACT (imprinted ancient) family translation regulator
MIDKHQLQQVALTVTRYFGGTKLGTGGLIRAYGDCADQLIEQAPTIKRVNYQIVTISYGFDQISKVQHLVHKYGAQISEDATPRGMKARISIPPLKKQSFLTEVINLTSGKIKILSEN